VKRRDLPIGAPKQVHGQIMRPAVQLLHSWTGGRRRAVAL